MYESWYRFTSYLHDTLSRNNSNAAPFRSLILVVVSSLPDEMQKESSCQELSWVKGGTDVLLLYKQRSSFFPAIKQLCNKDPGLHG